MNNRGVGMSEYRAALGVLIALGSGSEPDEVTRATLQLRRELAELDVESVGTPKTGEAPPGTRATGLTGLGALVVNVAESQVLTSVITTIQSWLAASSRRSVRLELGGDVLELTGVSSSEQRRLTDEWLVRHAGR